MTKPANFFEFSNDVSEDGSLTNHLYLFLVGKQGVETKVIILPCSLQKFFWQYFQTQRQLFGHTGLHEGVSGGDGVVTFFFLPDYVVEEW